ncbi:MAG TPA: penicillin-binding protein activator, partial [Methylophilaceae bacterium]|nr:penicillin-binding protein activator [Methylophilaceae bacterium]
LLQWLITAGLALAEPASNSAIAASQLGKPITQIKKTPEASFLNGLNCLKQSDTACAQLALTGIPSQSPYAKLLAGNIAVAVGDFDHAFRLLLPLQAETGLLPQANASLHASLALAYDNQTDALRALEQRTLAERYLSDAAGIQSNQQRIWLSLSSLTKEQLVDMRGESSDTTIQGWIDLALTAQAKQSINDWRKAYPDHPVSAALTDQLMAQASNNNKSVVKPKGLEGSIALLLPFQAEAFYPTADAIWRGFVAAQTEANDDAEIKIYATRGDKDAVVTIYQQAIKEGARYVIAPLTRDEATRLAAGQMQVPTLALNQPDVAIELNADTANNFYMLGLSIDAEAAQIAKIARDHGMQTAVIVTSKKPLPVHMTKAFSDAWINEGGQIIAQVSIDENTILTDVKAQISAQPTDMILIAGNAEEARAIRPYLDAATPTFGFSHIYAGINHEPLDAALLAVRFIDLPWLLDNADVAFAPYQAAAADLPQGEMQRWFALGADAYQVLLALTQQPHKSATIYGLTGKIRINEKGEITRALALGRFGTEGVVLEKTP